MKIENKLFCISEVKGVNEEERSIEAWGSKPTMDRDNEIIATNAWNLKDFRKNPVLMLSHDYRQLPVGKIVSIKARPEGLWFKAVFAETARGEEVFQLYKQKIMKAFSVGFIPKAHEDKEQLDSKGNVTRYRLFKKADLLEVSCVSIPACPDALIAEIGAGNIKQKCIVETVSDILRDKEVELVVNKEFGIDTGIRCTGCDSGVCACEDFGKNVATDDDLDIEICTCGEDKCENCKDKEPEEEKTVIPYKSYGIAPVEETWNGPAAVAASDVKKLKDISTWFDGTKTPADLTKTDFKLPHHRASDKKAVWRGVVAAMAALLGARGGVKIPASDRKGVYNHLVGHYKEFDAEPPAFKEVYNEADLKVLNYDICSIVSFADIDFMCEDPKEEKKEFDYTCVICKSELKSITAEQNVCDECYDDDSKNLVYCDECEKWYDSGIDAKEPCSNCEEDKIKSEKVYLCKCVDCGEEFETKEYIETCINCDKKREMIKRNPILAGLSDGTLVAVKREELDELGAKIDRLETENKDGRVLSGKNRSLVMDAVKTLTGSIEALSILLDASEPKKPDGEDGKTVDDPNTIELDFSDEDKGEDELSLEEVVSAFSDVLKELPIRSVGDLVREEVLLRKGKVL